TQRRARDPGRDRSGRRHRRRKLDARVLRRLKKSPNATKIAAKPDDVAGDWLHEQPPPLVSLPSPASVPASATSLSPLCGHCALPLAAPETWISVQPFGGNFASPP